MTKGQSSYYKSGSTELAVDTPLIIKKLERRQKLTRNSNRLVIVLVGLPARGKSFVSRKMYNFLTWGGNHCKIFNVGKYRREAHAALTMSKSQDDEEKTSEREKVGSCDANFFDSSNKEAAFLREQAAEAALRDMLRWLDTPESGDDDSLEEDADFGRRDSSASSTASPYARKKMQADRIAIFDATNSTRKRRQWILEECTSPEKRQGKPPTGVVFVESICDDQELLEENFRFKVTNSPDFQGMTQEEATADLRQRVKKYEEQYETITDDSQSYIKIFNLSSKLLLNHIYGRMAKMIVPALMAWHIGTRPVYLCRAGCCLSPPRPSAITTTSMSDSDESEVGGEDITERGDDVIIQGAEKVQRLSQRSGLGPNGKKFRNDLFKFIEAEGTSWANHRSSIMDCIQTGTSVTGLYDTFQYGYCPSDAPQHDEPPFPVKIFASTLPRTSETLAWDAYDFHVNQLSSLNPLDKGDYAGMEINEIKDHSPDFFSMLETDPFQTRFPGGESYSDLISRLTHTIIDIEQQVIPTLVVSHISTLQVLIAYFRNTPIEKCMNIEIPLHTVIKFDPVRGGGWSESRYPLSDVNLPRVPSDSDCSGLTAEETANTCSPFWGDHDRVAQRYSSCSQKA